VARKFLDECGISVRACTTALGGICIERFDWEEVDRNPFFCPDEEAAKRMQNRLEEVKRVGDSVGGIVQVVAQGCPPGLGEPVFDKLDARLAAALMSIGAVKGVEIGEGFAAAGMLGSENNDPITPHGYGSNHAGGILGGISTGMDIIARAAVKPIPSISIPQATITSEGEPTTIRIGGRHDISAIPRIVPVCEAMVMLVLADFMLYPLLSR
jgi:chorismate synthase